MADKLTAGSSLDVWALFTGGGPAGMAIMLLLLVLSVLTWAVIVERWRALGFLQKKSEDFLKLFWDSKSLSELHLKSKEIEYSPARDLFRAGYNEMVRVVQVRDKKGLPPHAAVPFDTVKRSLAKARQIEEHELAKRMTLLAISATACPFIGLLGTVVGIIRAFHDIGQAGSTTLAAVAPGVSEALVATAMGLAAAIPATIFYNALAARGRGHLLLLDGFSADFLNILERHFNIGKGEHMSSQTAHGQNTLQGTTASDAS